MSLNHSTNASQPFNQLLESLIIIGQLSIRWHQCSIPLIGGQAKSIEQQVSHGLMIHHETSSLLRTVLENFKATEANINGFMTHSGEIHQFGHAACL